jgi:hypothetical protein
MYSILSQDDINKYESLIKLALTNELQNIKYENMSKDDIITDLFAPTDTGNNYVVIVAGLPYSSNIITVDDLNNL